MTMQQWNAHKQHMDEHISWPATKQEILKACEGTDVEPQVLDEIKMKLKDGDMKYSETDFMNMIVS